MDALMADLILTWLTVWIVGMAALAFTAMVCGAIYTAIRRRL